MATEPTIVAFSGSGRKGSYNTLLVRAAAACAEKAGAKVTYIDLQELALPIFNEDDEKASGFPDGAKRLRAAMLPADGLLISSPEYNSSVSALLKNAIDWASRPEAGTPPLGCFSGKVAGIMSASPGALGGLRGLVHLRMVLGNIGVLVLPQQFAVSKAGEAFDANGGMKDDKQRGQIDGLAQAVVATARKLRAG
jgi:chromate reductase